MSAATKPILFNTEMVRAILDGRKTMTRRIAKGRNYKVDYVPETYNHLVKGNVGDFYYFTKDKIKNGWGETINFYDALSLEKLTDAMKKHNDFPFNIGDILWVRETWSDYPKLYYWYKADFPLHWDAKDTEHGDEVHIEANEIKWKPSIHMPKDYARIFLRVTNVRVERLQDINDDDAYNECGQYPINEHGENFAGEFPIEVFENLWNSTTKEGYKWEDNPYVFVYEFEKVEKPL